MSWFGNKDKPDNNSDEKTTDAASSSETGSSDRLRVDSAYPGDQGCGKIRLDPATMLLLNVSPGDIVAIEGKRRTVSKIWGLIVEDYGVSKVRLDNFTRQNAGVAIGDTVKIIKISEEVEARRVVLASTEDPPKKIPIASIPSVINGLLDFPMTINDTVPIMLGLPGIQPQIVAFKVVELEPEEAIVITNNTLIEFSNNLIASPEVIKQSSYDNIGGLKDQIKQIREIIELPLLHPELFQKLGIDPCKGVLLYGPTGTGKTLIAKALEKERGAVHFIYISGPEVILKYGGESERRLREIFKEARENAPSIIFIEELESIASRREEATGELERRVVAQLLSVMDGLEERGNVIVIGAARRIDLIEPALRRGGRFDREIEIGLPDEQARIEILTIHTRAMPLSEDICIGDIAQQTNGFSGADLVELCKEAAIRAYKNCISEELMNKNFCTEEIPIEILEKIRVSSKDFQNAIPKINNKIVSRNTGVNKNI